MKRKLSLVIIMSLFLTSCGMVRTDKTDKLTVYASFYAMNDFACAIGGEDIVYHSVVPLGAEPHDFEPTAADMAKLSDADVFVYNGMGIDSWAEKVKDALPEDVITVCAGDNLNGTSENTDPHVWLNFENAKTQLENIYKAFSTADNKNSERYLGRLLEYSAHIDRVQDEYENAGLEGLKLFVTHGAYGYLCDEFGMEQIALEGISGDSDPSPAQMADIVEQIRNEGAKCIFYDPIEGDKMAMAVASEAGVEALPLYTFEGDSEHRDYVTIMELNLEQLKKAV